MPSDRHWVGTWAAAPAPAEGVVGFNNHTLRMNPRISLGGDRLRVRISNAYGNRPLTIGAAQIALRDKGPAIVADTGRKLSFGGSNSAVIAAGAVLFSDPVELSVPPLADLAVSFHLPGEVLANFAITGRYARQTNYISPPGNFVADRIMPVLAQKYVWSGNRDADDCDRHLFVRRIGPRAKLRPGHRGRALGANGFGRPVIGRNNARRPNWRARSS